MVGELQFYNQYIENFMLVILIYGFIYFQQYDHGWFVAVIECPWCFFLATFLQWNQWDSSHSSTSEPNPEDLVREKYEKHADLRVEHGLHWYMAWHGVTLERKGNRIWNQRLLENKSLDYFPLLLASLASAAISLPYYLILTETSDLRRKKPHFFLENG